MRVPLILVSRNCVWPSRETNSHYTRPIIPASQTITFGATPFSNSNTSPFFAQSAIFGQQQAQLWSRFRYAASTLRNDTWSERTDATLQEVPSNLFTSNYHTYNIDHSPTLLSPQIVPTRVTPFHNRTSEEPSGTVLRQRRNSPTTHPISSPSSVNTELISQPSSKLLFTLVIFVIGLALGCFLTNTLPHGLIWENCVKYIHILYAYLHTMIKSMASSI